jgi:hypothetical protein
MKIMSGAEPEAIPDYSQQTRKELDKVQSRAVLLNNMLDNANEGEKFARGDAYEVSHSPRQFERNADLCCPCSKLRIICRVFNLDCKNG